MINLMPCDARCIKCDRTGAELETGNLLLGGKIIDGTVATVCNTCWEGRQ